MNYRAHLFVGICCGATASFLLRLDLPAAALFTAISAAASLLPDLDIGNSKASQAARAAALLAALAAAFLLSFANGGGAAEFLSYFVLVAAALIAAGILLRPRHRGIMHGVPFALAAAAIFYAALGLLAALAFAIGYLSHLAADRLP